ncbi:MAG TPA: hypothetical protein VGB81_17300 [Devosia sp.]|jgi:hypothetical protein
MLSTFPLAREHLQCAALALEGTDSRSRQLRYIIERTVTLMDEIHDEPQQCGSNVLDFASFRNRAARSH